MKTKQDLRTIVLDIIFGRRDVTYQPSQFGHLTAGVAEILTPRQVSGSVFQPEAKLDEDDWLLVQEIFWDLVSARVITLGTDSSNKDFPWFRLHSEAESNLASANSKQGSS